MKKYLVLILGVALESIMCEQLTIIDITSVIVLCQVYCKCRAPYSLDNFCQLGLYDDLVL